MAPSLLQSQVDAGMEASLSAQRTTRKRVPRSLEFAQFAIGVLWLLAARAGAESAADGFTHLLHAEIFRILLVQVFFLLLLLTGYTVLHWLAARQGSVRATNGLRWRPTAVREWQKGAAVGWALLLVTLVPMAVVGDLHPEFWFGARAWATVLLGLVTLFVAGLTIEVAYRGFLLQRLVAATSPITGTVLLSLVYAFLITSPVNTTPFSFFVAFTGGVLFSAAYLRTAALWLGWGIRFGWMASMAVLFGLPLQGTVDFAGVVTTDSTGHPWLTGGAYGPEGAVFTGLVLLAGAIALFPLTRDYAWSYTQPEISPAGYPMEVAPPPAHAAMEAAAGPQLVQIGGLGLPLGERDGTSKDLAERRADEAGLPPHPAPESSLAAYPVRNRPGDPES